jgi:RNA-binding protein
MNKISTKELTQLRAQAHKLNPVVIIGNNGLTPAVLLEIDRALNDHELVKIKVSIKDRSEKLIVINALCKQSNAILVKTIGHIAIIYRKNLKLKKEGKNEPKKRSDSKRQPTQKRQYQRSS